jgi:histone deacetylase complex regulatory component SIN3
MRELRVEDALLYLDQVKVEFGDRPHIYNEFLDIMKTFKTQQIDTPGVIRRVSNLFQGNKRLVLGFNTFLPEGYKIELDGDGPPIAVFRSPGETVTHILSGPGAPPIPPFVSSHAQGGGGDSPAAVRLAGATLAASGARAGLPAQMQAAMGGGPQGGGGGHQRGPSQDQASLAAQQQQQQQQQHTAYEGQQQMHQQQQRPGQQQQMMGSDAAARARLEVLHHGQQQQQQQLGGPGGRLPQQHAQPRPGMGMPGVAQQPISPQGKMPAAVHHQHAGVSGFSVAAQISMQQQQQQHDLQLQQRLQQESPPPEDDAPNPPLEFDHAINYVTTIKKRFASEPETYKKFLEILHTYQKEQRGIKEVLDEVSVLFADHPDLLKEFTYFLPDAVQAQAKAQLDQVAKESEARKRASLSKQAIMQQAQGMQRQAQGMVRAPPPPPAAAPREPQSSPVHNAPTVAPIPFGATQGRSVEREREIYRSSVYGSVSFAPVRPPRKKALCVQQSASKNGRPTMLPPLPLQPTTAETAFFERAKMHLNRKELAPDKPAGSRRHTPYTEFLKCLHLFGADILNKDELVLLLRGLFMQGHAPKSGVNAGGGASNPTIANDAHELLREFEEVSRELTTEILLPQTTPTLISHKM